MPSFPDSIFLFVLALLLFGPKRLPALARELGKWVGEFRRASNEFKMQMEDELRLNEQADRQKQIAAMEAAAPVVPLVSVEEPSQLQESSGDSLSDGSMNEALSETTLTETAGIEQALLARPQRAHEVADGVRTPLPIATSGELSIMPPSTGLPTPQEPSGPRNSALRGLLDAIPPAPESTTDTTGPTETNAHGN